jgi:hypothetical protein
MPLNDSDLHSTPGAGPAMVSRVDGNDRAEGPVQVIRTSVQVSKAAGSLVALPCGLSRTSVNRKNRPPDVWVRPNETTRVNTWDLREEQLVS